MSTRSFFSLYWHKVCTLPSVDTNFMTFIISLLENFGPRNDLLTNDKEGNLDINGLEESQKFTSDFIWSIIETLIKRTEHVSFCGQFDYLLLNNKLTVPQTVTSLQ